MTKKQHYMTEPERYKLEAYLRAGKSRSWIAREMGFCRKTIYNEIQRGSCLLIRYKGGYEKDVIEYSADKAQQIHRYNQTAKGRPLKIGNDHTYAKFLEDCCMGVQADGHIDKRRRCSPAAALELARREGFKTKICVATLYSYIDKGVFLHLTNKHLIVKGLAKKQRKAPVRRTVHPLWPSITERPLFITQRSERGHWEMDLIIGASGTKACLFTMYERKTREFLLFKLPDHRACTVRSVFDKLERDMGKQRFRDRFKTITTDNGPEFLEYEQLRQSIYGGCRFQVYYCHPYSAWEKGGNECYNRMARRWFPKGTDFTRITKKEVAELQEWMNGYPRKVLNWMTPNEAAA